MVKIFVYGSLREGMYNYDIYLKGKVLKIQRAYVKGELYQLKDVRYPALLAGDTYITGEIMELKDTQILTELDAMEGFIDEGNPENEYHRKLCDIYDEDKQVIERLPVYFYNDENPQFRKRLKAKIQSGDYVAFIKNSQM